MTGYRPPRAEWLADVRSGAMTYHSMEDVDWPPQLRITFERTGSSWLAAGTVASTWG
jgi:hypothetical protein